MQTLNIIGTIFVAWVISSVVGFMASLIYQCEFAPGDGFINGKKALAHGVFWPIFLVRLLYRSFVEAWRS